MCGHFGKSKMLSWFNMTSIIIMCGFNLYCDPDSSLNITLIFIYRWKQWINKQYTKPKYIIHKYGIPVQEVQDSENTL